MRGTAVAYATLASALAMASACATTAPATQVSVDIPQTDPHGDADTEAWPDLPSDLELKQLARLLDGARHVHVGETHAEVASQSAQLAVLEALRRARPHLVVGVEWLPADRDPVLASWSAGDLAEDQLADALDWKKAWGHPMATYLPIFRWARDQHIQLVGLNPPLGLARRFARVGPEGLTDLERSQLPPLDTAEPRHREWFCDRISALMASHGGHHGGDPADAAEAAPPSDDPCATVPARYYEAQLIRDETMARVAASHLADPDTTVVVLAGTGHVVHGLGVPSRVTAATGLKGLVVLQPTGLDEDEMSPELERRFGPPADVWWPPRVE